MARPTSPGSTEEIRKTMIETRRSVTSDSPSRFSRKRVMARASLAASRLREPHLRRVDVVHRPGLDALDVLAHAAQAGDEEGHDRRHLVVLHPGQLQRQRLALAQIGLG